MELNTTLRTGACHVTNLISGNHVAQDRTGSQMPILWNYRHTGIAFGTTTPTTHNTCVIFKF